MDYLASSSHSFIHSLPVQTTWRRAWDCGRSMGGERAAIVVMSPCTRLILCRPWTQAGPCSCCTPSRAPRDSVCCTSTCLTTQTPSCPSSIPSALCKKTAPGRTSSPSFWWVWRGPWVASCCHSSAWDGVGDMAGACQGRGNNRGFIWILQGEPLRKKIQQELPHSQKPVLFPALHSKRGYPLDLKYLGEKTPALLLL